MHLVWIIPLSVFIFYFAIPEMMYSIQLKNVINSEIKTGEIVNKSVNLRTRVFFESHKELAASVITDFQGSDYDTGYLVASMKGDHALGVFVQFKAFGPYLTDYQIIWVKLNE
ncbi:hypothetical protein [Companilactobacillus furfuricola]|uniref:hypothetical protein n=1 Tax=Companilactobacillus furfuricola TaxID=1462575 RepID=UPI000F799033|nr:hypothetical protein [Companilactobacillus furfuricola]